MIKRTVQLSSEFKAQATKAVIALASFAFIYLIILISAVGLTALCIAGGIFLISLKPTFITFALGIGLSSLGILILIFLLKFIFKSHKADRSHLIEINNTDEPELFNLIDNIVKEVGTRYPKNVYLSSDVNASVFYDSSFWSMFLPIKKNLQIGLGLVNTVTKEELKAILCHEFGHFSQRTMKVGSYVYNVNQVIFNMLYENESYESLMQRWANVSGYFSFFVAIAVKINEGIQWVLRKMYEVVNKNYLGLSREMEFHADEIAASITGYEPLKNSLLRMSLADNSFNNVLNFYNGKISENIKSENIYRDQTDVVKFLAEVNNLPIKNSLPDISLEEQSKFDKSKLVIKDQWASHPTIEERVRRLEHTGFSTQNKIDAPANNIFRDIDNIQKRLTNKLFEFVSYEGEAKFISSEKFQEEYKEEILANSFAKVYNGYYDNKNPTQIALNNGKLIGNIVSFNELFSDEKVDLVYTAIALQSDIEILKNIANNSIAIKTFDYDGVRYKRKNGGELIGKLEIELADVNEQINKNDNNIYDYFKKLENEQGKPERLESLYSGFYEFDKIFEFQYSIYTKLLNGLQFVNTTTPFEEIRTNLASIEPLEESLKLEIANMLSDSIYTAGITNEIRQNFEHYISKTWEYFNGTHYYEENLNILYTAMHNYGYLLSKEYFINKKRLLAYQEELTENYMQQHLIQGT